MGDSANVDTHINRSGTQNVGPLYAEEKVYFPQIQRPRQEDKWNPAL